MGKKWIISIIINSKYAQLEEEQSNLRKKQKV